MTQNEPQVEAVTGVRARRAAATRERILDAAAALFYDEGIRAVSADRVISAVGVNKGTFYRYFPSKDDLAAAYLDRRSELEREAADRLLGTLTEEPSAVFQALAGAAGEETCSPGFRGCPFINAAAEYADPTHPIRRAVDRHRQWFKEMIEGQLKKLDIEDVPVVADELILLRDGSMVSGYLSDPTAVGPTLGRAVQAIIDDAS